MRNTNLCINRYIEDGCLNNIALRIGKGNCVLADIYESTEKNITDSTLFDMASVTKVMVTSMLCLIAIDKKKIALEDSVSKFFDVEDEKQKIKIKDLLVHTIGIGHKSLLFEGCNYDNVQNFVLKIPSDVPIGSETLYSCPGYILLGKILENVYGKRLDELFCEFIAKPLGMKRTSFHPDNKNQFVNSNLLPGEIGMVNDYNCRFLGGVAGHAGLFSCVEDVSRYVEMLLNFGYPLISSETFEIAIKNHTEKMSESRALGFVYVDNKYTQTGGLFPEGSIGHCGHTGQSVFVDLKSELYVIILSDATISGVKKYGMEKYDIVMKMREEIHNAIKKDLESGLI